MGKSKPARPDPSSLLTDELFAHIPEGLSVVRADGLSIAYASPKLEKLFGYEPDEMIGQNISSLIAPTDKFPHERVKEVHAGEDWSGEINTRKKDGTPFRCSANISLCDHANYGEVFVATFTDISELKRAEKKVSETEIFNQLIIENTTAGILVFKESGPCVLANPAAENIVGVSAEQMLKLNFREMDSYRRNGILADMEEVLRTGTVIKSEVRTVNTFGREVWFEGVISAFQQAGEKHILYLFNDIMKREKAEEVLIRSEEHHRAILRAALDGVWLLDASGRFIEVNKAYCRMSGYSEKELLSMSIYEVENVETVEEAAAHIAQTLRDGQAVFVSQHRRKDGTTFDVEVSAQYRSVDGGRFVVFVKDITERLRADKILRESEERYRLLFQNLPSGFALHEIIHGDDGTPCNYKFLEVNPAFEKITGLNAPDLIGRTVQDVIPTIEPSWIERYGQVTLTGEPVSFEEFNAALNKYFQVCAYSPEPHKFATIFHEITERKQAEQELFKAQAMLQAAMDCSPAGIAIADAPDGKLRYVNEAGLLIRGGSRESVVNGVGIDQYVNSWQLLDLDGRPLNDDEVPLARAILFGETSSRDFIIRRSETDDRIVTATAAPIKNEAGKVQSAIVVFLDITQQKQAEKENKDLADRLLLATSSGRLGIWDWDVRENTMVWDDRMYQLYGVTKEEAPSNVDVWLNGLHPEDKETAIAECQAALKGEKEFDTEFRVLHPDGTVKYIKGNGLVVMGADGKPDRMLGINLDITEQKQATEEKINLQHQLQQTQKIESIGQLAGGIAHDFNNMLGVILGHTELALLKIDPSNPLVDDLEIIRTAAKRSSELTRQLLTFARKQAVSPQLLDLNETVSSLLKMLQRLIGENIHLAWNPGTNLWAIEIDPSQLDQILANLCVNARDAIGGSGEITIETHNFSFSGSDKQRPPEAQQEDYVRLSVADNGCGIAKDQLDQIFEPFFTTKEFGQGTGLGLATVYGAVKQNNGFVEVVSEPGQGTSFHIFLPRQQTDVKPVEEMTEKSLHHGVETILVVEDDQMLLELVVTMLDSRGYKVLGASNVDDAITMANDYPETIHLLLTDLIMPGMNGRELRDLLQGIRPDMKTVFMSGYTADIIAKQGVLEEGIQLLQKPVTFAALTAKVRQVLDLEI